MTEQEWLTCTDPSAMLNYLRGKASDRKLRLFACACCRRNASILRGGKDRGIFEASEDFADGRIDRKFMEHLWREWYTSNYPVPRQATWQTALAFATMTMSIRVTDMIRQASETASYSAQARNRPDDERRIQSAVLRDVINLYNSAAVDSSWLSWNDGIIPKLAQAIYDDRAFDRLPILADALEEAGCTNADILNHCRQPGEHVRGCWVVDLLLGKS